MSNTNQIRIERFQSQGITARTSAIRRTVTCLALVSSAVVLSACVSVNPIEPPVSGYDAIEFTRATVVQDHAWNQYVFPAGRRFIGDRLDPKGRTLYCGVLTINGDPRPFDTCIGFIAPNTLILGPNAGFKEVQRPQAPGTIRMIKVRL